MTTVQRLSGLVLSAADLRELTDWPEALIEDYLNLLDNFIKVAGALDEEITKTIEETPTNFSDGSIPFAFDNFLRQDNTNLTWDSVNNLLKIFGAVISNLTENMSVATDADKKLVSIPYLNEETEFFIQAVC